MAQQDETVSVPQELFGEVKVILDILREQRQGIEEDVMLLNPESRDLLLGGAGEIILFIGGGALSWVTKKWVDDILWPELKKRIEAPSKRAIEFVFGEAPTEELKLG